jgi:hypothetical protein
VTAIHNLYASLHAVIERYVHGAREQVDTNQTSDFLKLNFVSLLTKLFVNCLTLIATLYEIVRSYT